MECNSSLFPRKKVVFSSANKSEGETNSFNCHPAKEILGSKREDTIIVLLGGGVM